MSGLKAESDGSVGAAAPVEPRCKTCRDKGEVLKSMEAVVVTGAPTMMIKTFGKCPDCQAVSK
jgi:hypothetical protein